MKKFVLLISILFSLLFIGNVSAEDTKGKFVIGEWEPYTGEKMDNYGMAAEIVTAACKAAGIVGEYEFAPWKRAENNVLTGISFGTFPYKEIEERKANYKFSNTLFSSSFAILIHKKNPKTSNFKFAKAEDLKNYTVGIVAGTDAIKIPLEKAGIKVEEVLTGDQNLKKLAAGRIDFYIDDKMVIFQALKKNYKADQSADFEFLQSDFGEKNDFKVMISQKYPESNILLDKLNDGIKKIADSGEQKAILAKYGL
jgi:polar amino acid transport system substrate-binding protein